MTKEYLGLKRVTAWPQEKDGQPGYGVRYSDGYTSWCPEATFEKHNMCLGESGVLTDDIASQVALALPGTEMREAMVLLLILASWAEHGVPRVRA